MSPRRPTIGPTPSKHIGLSRRGHSPIMALRPLRPVAARRCAAYHVPNGRSSCPRATAGGNSWAAGNSRRSSRRPWRLAPRQHGAAMAELRAVAGQPGAHHLDRDVVALEVADRQASVIRAFGLRVGSAASRQQRALVWRRSLRPRPAHRARRGTWPVKVPRGAGRRHGSTRRSEQAKQHQTNSPRDCAQLRRSL